jgi:hypothetical protein
MGMRSELRENVFTPGAKPPHVGAIRSGTATAASARGRTRLRRLRAVETGAGRMGILRDYD